MTAYSTSTHNFFSPKTAQKNGHVDRLRLKNLSANLFSLMIHLEIVDNTDQVLFDYMHNDQKEQLRFDLETTMALLLAQQEYENNHQKTENDKKYHKYMKQCRDLLRALDPEEQERMEYAPEQGALSEDKPATYLGIALGQEYGKQLVEFTNRKSKTIFDFLDALNEKRLYWVWGSVFLKTVFSSIPKDFFRATQASSAIRAPDPYTGNLSWILYYFRFSLHLFLLLKHTINGPWMSQYEAKTPWTERFQTQWAQRKFSLLNDSLWGTSNLLGFLWLFGKTILGTWGDALTLVLLVFDISVAIWDFEEQKMNYNKQMLHYDEDISQLEEHDAHTPQMETKRQLHALRREREQCKRDWEQSKLTLINNTAYAIGLMLAFVILAMPFMPIAAPTAATLTAVGAVLCFAFTVINNAIKGRIELYKIEKTGKMIQEDLDDKSMFIHAGLSAEEKKLKYLELKKLKVDIRHQNHMMDYQSIHLVRRIILETLIPALIFSSLVFLPLGIGVAALGVALGLAVVSHYLIEASCKPKDKKKLEFFADEYEQFSAELDTTSVADKKTTELICAHAQR